MASLSAPGSSPLERLPYVVLNTICGHLDDEGDDRDGLWAFSLTSRSCCAVAETRRFCELVLPVTTLDELNDGIVEPLKAVLGHGRRYGLVRRFKVQGALTIQASRNRNTNGMEQDEDEKDLEDECDDIDLYSNYGFSDMHPFCRLQKEVPTYDDDIYNASDRTRERPVEVWHPLADLLRQLPALRDLVWAGGGHVPRPILDAVHALHSPARPFRLHLSADYFAFHSLVYDPDRAVPPPISDDDYTLATSPALYSLSIRSFYSHAPEGHRNHSGGTLRRMMCGLAPNLTNVWLGRKHVPFRVYTFGQPGGMDHDVDNKQTMKRSNGKIQRLKVEPDIHPFPLDRWSTAHLRHLHLRWCRAVGEALADLAVDGHLPCLESVWLDHVYSSTPRAQTAMNTLLRHTTRPLVHFGLSGYLNDATFDLLTSRHGATLRVLAIDPSYDDGHRIDDDFDHNSPDDLFDYSVQSLNMLAERCPRLEKITIDMDRTRGDRHEVAMYRALSRLPRLQRVRLHLRCLVATEPLAPRHMMEGREGDYMLPLDALQETLTSSAVDAVLARAIFDVIAGHSEGQKQQHKNGLRYLRIEPRIRTDVNHDSDFYDVTRVLTRPWVCRRDKQYGDIVVREINKIWTRHAASSCATMVGERLKRFRFDPYFYPDVFMDLWKSTPTTWWEDWTSLPLSTNDA